MGAGHVYLIVVVTKNICTYHLMTAKEDVTLTLCVVVDSTSTSNATCRVGIGGLKWDNAVRVHGGTEGGEVGEASGGKARECEDCIKSSHVTTEDNCVGATWSCEPGSQGSSVS